MIKWYSPPKDAKIESVAMVVHGLNLNPDKMEAIINMLTLASIKVLLLSLSGHGDNYLRVKGKNSADSRMETLKGTNYKVWKEETLSTYQCVKTEAEKDRIPVYFIGYSLGGLLGCDILVTQPEVQFDKMVLFAPAISLQPFSAAFKWLSPFSGMVVPSGSPKSYRSNKGTPVTAYLALINAAIRFKKNLDQQMNVPTLVLIDKYDELVSYSRLRRLIASMKLDRWQLYRIKKDSDANRFLQHHLILDADTTGLKAWGKLEDRLLAHLKMER